MGQVGGSGRDPGLTGRAALVAAILIGLVIAAGCTAVNKSPPTTLKVIAAGSLLAPFAEAEKEFESSHPGVDVQVEGHGSIQVIRQITDLHRKADVVAVADETLIPDLMYRKMEGSDKNYTDWYLPFATNEMVIAYTNKSRYHDEISPDNWYVVLDRPDVRVGFSNPMLDASGYRALMVVQLAEDQYGDPGLFERLIARHFPSTVVASASPGGTVITLPEIMRPSDEKVVVRDGSIYLLSLLEAGGIDYAFEYRSVAEGMGMPFITLPGPINLGSAEFAGSYRNVSVVLGFPRFSSIGRERIGRPIVYGMTIPVTADNPDLGQEFIDYVRQESGSGRIGWPPPPR